MVDAIPQLAVMFPKYPGEEQLVGMPLTLPMGWLESIPYFCASTEMVADQANNWCKVENLPPHPLECLALMKPADEETRAHEQSTCCTTHFKAFKNDAHPVYGDDGGASRPWRGPMSLTTHQRCLRDARAS